MAQVRHDFDTATRARIRRRLLEWYDRVKRDLPWRRREHDAYAQMLAELMLQQTQVATVIAYYERFMARFPTVGHLARASLDEVLALWSGLGYYRRARHLHAAARQIVEQHGGVVPDDVPGLMSLPGIGRYTAGAVASIAYGRRAAVLDGNVARVLIRLLAMEEHPQSPGVRDHLWQVAERLLPPRRCGDFNQGLMELGATLCRPKAPACAECPFRGDCRAHRDGLAGRLPLASPRPRVQSVEHVVVAIRHRGRMLFVQRPVTGLWAGLWELPSEPLVSGESPRDGLRRLRRRLALNCRIKNTPAGTTKRQLTHRTICFHVFEGVASTPAMPKRTKVGVVDARSDRQMETAGLDAAATSPAARWLDPADLPQVGLSRAGQAILQLLGWGA